MSSTLRKWLKKPLDWLSEVQIVSHPLWLVTGPVHNKVKAEHIRQVLSVVRQGDIIFRRQERALGTKVIPGYFSHVGIVKNKTTVIHAVSVGVVEEDILDFLRTDACAVLHIPDAALRRKAANKAKSCLGKPYDYIFDSDDKRALYCTELAMYCYPDVVPKRKQKQDAVSPDDLLTLEGCLKLYDTRAPIDVASGVDNSTSTE